MHDVIQIEQFYAACITNDSQLRAPTQVSWCRVTISKLYSLVPKHELLPNLERTDRASFGNATGQIEFGILTENILAQNNT